MDVVEWLFRLRGRIGRAQFWLGILVSVALSVLGYMLSVMVEETRSLPLALFNFALSLMNLWICICVYGKRYHDRGKSAWWILVAIIPVIGWIWSFIELGLLRGDAGANRFGSDPLAESKAAGDIAALRAQSPAGHAVAVAVAPAPRPRSPYTDGRPVFGKRV